MPTVVDVATITSDTIDLFIDKMKSGVESGENSNLYKMLENLSNEDKYEMMKEVLVPNDYNFIVTPKEIDQLIDNMSGVVARGINMALQ